MGEHVCKGGSVCVCVGGGGVVRVCVCFLSVQSCHSRNSCLECGSDKSSVNPHQPYVIVWPQTRPYPELRAQGCGPQGKS